MPAVEVLEEPGAAMVALDPLRSRMLGLLATEPASAAGLAPALGLARQKVRYHLQALAGHGLVREVGHQQHGGLTERLFSASADAYVVSPGALGPAGIRAGGEGAGAGRLSGAYLVALAARAVQEVGALLRGAAAADRRLATLSVDAEVRFRSAADRAAFTAELEAGIVGLVAKYHHPHAPAGRRHRVVVLAHPVPQEAAS